MTIVMTVLHVSGERDIYEFTNLMAAGKHLAKANYEFRKVVKVMECTNEQDGETVRKAYEEKKAALLESISAKLTPEEMELLEL